MHHLLSFGLLLWREIMFLKDEQWVHWRQIVKISDNYGHDWGRRSVGPFLQQIQYITISFSQRGWCTREYLLLGSAATQQGALCVCVREREERERESFVAAPVCFVFFYGCSGNKCFVRLQWKEAVVNNWSILAQLSLSNASIASPMEDFIPHCVLTALCQPSWGF